MTQIPPPAAAAVTSPHVPSLGRLTPVPPREVWPHEAHSFTPWLLNNVDVLADLLGMDLAAYGGPLDSQALPNRKATRVAEYLAQVDVALEEQWPTYLDWLLERRIGRAVATPTPVPAD